MSSPVLSRAVGWIGTGRMGFALAGRLLDAGADLRVWNRTRSKAEPLAARGRSWWTRPPSWPMPTWCSPWWPVPMTSSRSLVGPNGVLSRHDSHPAVLVDSTTIDPATSARLREEASARGTAVLAAPVSGNPKVVASGRLTVVVSGPRDAFEVAQPYLEPFGRRVTYVGPGDEARLVKICHNLLLGVVTQSMAEITVLAEAAGVTRRRSSSSSTTA